RHRFAKPYLADASGGAASQLALNGLDLVPGDLHWTSSSSFLFTGETKGEIQIFRGDLAAHGFAPATSGPRGVRALDVNAGAGKMVYLASDFQHPDDLFIANLDGSNEKKLTDANRELWSQLELQSGERLAFNSKDGWAGGGFFVKPLGWQAGKKYPMVLVIHGGPEGMFGVNWYHEFQVY